MVKAYVGIGSNIEPEIHVAEGIKRLKQIFTACRFSSIFESEAVGFKGDNFHNLVVEFDTELTIDELVAQLNQIENECGRERLGPKFSARTLDLDLLLYGDRVCQTPVVLPREEILENAFVLWPLSELVPEMEHPQLGVSFINLWKDFDKTLQKLWIVKG